MSLFVHIIILFGIIIAMCLLYRLLSVIFRHPMGPRVVSYSFSRSPETPTLPNQAKVTPSRERPSGKGQKRIIGDDPRSYAPGGKTLQGKNFQKAFQKAFLVMGRHLKTESSKEIYPRGRLPRRKDHSTETRPSESSTLGHRTFDRGITDLNYSPPSREFTVASALSYRSQDNCSRQVGSFIR